MKTLVLYYLMKFPNEGKTPTQIGMALGKTYTTASSSVASAIRSLVKEGKIRRHKMDGRVTYQIVIDKGAVGVIPERIAGGDYLNPGLL